MSTSKVNGLPGGESQREQSHAVKAGSVGRCVRRAALRDLRDMAKAILLEPQFPVMNLTIPRYRIYTARPSVLFKAVFVEQGSLDRWTAANEPLKGMKRVPKSRECFLCVNVGLPTGREPYGNGASVVVRGRESRPHGEGRQVFKVRNYRGMRNAES